jgi:hypothetical protein
MGGEDYTTVIPKAEENKSFCDEVFPNSPIAGLASGKSGLLYVRSRCHLQKSVSGCVTSGTLTILSLRNVTCEATAAPNMD